MVASVSVVFVVVFFHLVFPFHPASMGKDKRVCSIYNKVVLVVGTQRNAFDAWLYICSAHITRGNNYKLKHRRQELDPHGAS